MNKKTNQRVRNWTFIIYPDSVVDNWQEVMNLYFTPWILSPLHDKDIDATGEPKKPHYHVLLLNEGKKSFEQIKELTDALNSPIPQPCASAKGLVRYMAHMDNPDKAQYSISEIKAYCGADVSMYLKATSSTRYELIGEMMDFIQDNDITEMKDLMFYARNNRFEDWFPLLCDNSAYVLGETIKSMRYTKYTPKNKINIDEETGEVIE